MVLEKSPGLRAVRTENHTGSVRMLVIKNHIVPKTDQSLILKLKAKDAVMRVFGNVPAPNHQVLRTRLLRLELKQEKDRPLALLPGRAQSRHIKRVIGLFRALKDRRVQNRPLGLFQDQVHDRLDLRFRGNAHNRGGESGPPAHLSRR